MAINTAQGAGTVITEYDQWRLSTTTQMSAGDILIYNLERQDASGGYIGTGMSTNNGIWTFPRTGLWHIHHQMAGYVNANIAYSVMGCDLSTDSGSNYSFVSGAWQGSNYNITNPHFMQSSHVVLDITNTSTMKIRFRFDLPQAIYVFGGNTYNATAITFMRVGDT